ncbi:MAG: hypothetical protein HQ557_07460 [Bacteroidetes bacterium]|nr:hypothetical protein [Bacteroidota bacterium]
MFCSLFTKAVDSLFDGGYKLAPQIPTNEIDFEITGIGTGMRGYDNFPSITLFVTPKKLEGELITEMQEADFFEIGSDFSGVIDSIGTAITTRGDYMITFMTNDFHEDRVHEIRIAIHTSEGDAQDTALLHFTSCC